MGETDLELLERYCRQNAEDAFAEVVRRHLGLVYSAALRQVHSPQLAEEVAQSAFLKLTRHARQLAPDTIIAAWLYQITRREAIDVVRREARRRLREQTASEMNAMNAAAADWTDIEPLLDEAMHTLDDADRVAVLLRYFEHQSLRQVAQALGTSDDAAQKRVSRAVERLREFFAKRGILVGASGLVAVVSLNAVQAAPVGLAFAISTAAAAMAGTSLGASAAASTVIVMTTLQKTLITATIAAAVGTGIYEARQAARARDELETIRRQHTEQRQQLERDRDEAAVRLAVLSEENQRLKGATGELLKLRDEVRRLRARQPEPVPTRAANGPPVGPPASPAAQPGETELPKESWADAGFGTPQDALRTRGWAVLNGSRNRFKESVFITDGARKTLEDLFVRMAEASKDPNKAQHLQEVLNNGLGVEEGLLMPMMAEHRRKGYTGYRILSEQSLSADEKLLEVETRMTSAATKTEALKFRRFGNDWKVVIDEDFIQSAR